MQFLALSVSLSHYKFVLYSTSVLLRRQTNRDVVHSAPQIVAADAPHRAWAGSGATRPTCRSVIAGCRRF